MSRLRRPNTVLMISTPFGLLCTSMMVVIGLVSAFRGASWWFVVLMVALGSFGATVNVRDLKREVRLRKALNAGQAAAQPKETDLQAVARR